MLCQIKSIIMTINSCCYIENNNDNKFIDIHTWNTMKMTILTEQQAMAFPIYLFFHIKRVCTSERIHFFSSSFLFAFFFFLFLINVNNVTMRDILQGNRQQRKTFII